MVSFILPDVSTFAGAKHAIRYGLAIAIILALLRLYSVFVALSEGDLGFALLTELIIWILIAYGLSKHRLDAAVAGLGFYMVLPLMDIYLLAAKRVNVSMVTNWAICITFLVNGIRGTAAMRSFVNAQSKEDVGPDAKT